MDNSIQHLRLLGKSLEEYPRYQWAEEAYATMYFPSAFKKGNIRAITARLKDDFEKEARDLFLMEGNELVTTHDIISRVRVISGLGILTDEQWGRAIPIIERGLEANRAYVRMLDEMSPILEKYCKEFEDVNMRFMFRQRVKLECWQGRFSDHWANPERKPNYE